MRHHTAVVRGTVFHLVMSHIARTEAMPSGLHGDAVLLQYFLHAE